MPKEPTTNEPKRQRNPQAMGAGNGGRVYERPTRDFSWDFVPNDSIARLVKAVTAARCGIVLGRTSDGGALSITILDGEERIREWPATQDDYDMFLRWCETNLSPS